MGTQGGNKKEKGVSTIYCQWKRSKRRDPCALSSNVPEVTNKFSKASVVAVDTFHQQDGEKDLRPNRDRDLVKCGESGRNVLGTWEADACL